MARTFASSKAAERNFQKALKRVARIVAGMVQTHIHGSRLSDGEQMMRLLREYAKVLTPWATRVAHDMVDDVARTNRKAFERRSRTAGMALRGPLAASLEGQTARMLQHRQVELITSLPIQAGERAQRLAQQAQHDGTRAAEIAEQLAQTEQVTVSRATLIARTEVAKANAALTQARAEAVGATHYQWETVEDADTRDTHAAMQGTVHRFDTPPTLGDGMTGNPGEFPNCRCFAVPILHGEPMGAASLEGQAA